eukprot:comp17992_c0_seq1/m.31357 comp17992_c0_seq1/g.31357  ORF comp17992_c0_seq1/g.31357 comp17992_c0_seq1/m.31357 type:complete len:321 (-) comp17992_c0_seq1:57-1019(-)
MLFPLVAAAEAVKEAVKETVAEAAKDGAAYEAGVEAVKKGYEFMGKIYDYEPSDNFWNNFMDHPVFQAADEFVQQFGPPIPARVIVFAIPLLLVLVLLWVVVSVLTREKDRLNTILIMGPEASGKTCLWHWLRYGKKLHSVTSMQPNDETFALHSETSTGVSGCPTHIVDLPGHPRLNALAKDFFPITRGIIYMLDSTTFKDQIRVIADQLYLIFTSDKLVKNDCEVFIACNKIDLPTAKAPALIKKVLEKELTSLAKSKAASPDAIGKKEEEEILLVDEDEEFDFEKAPMKTYFVETTLTSEKDTVRQFEGFIRSIVHY